MLVVCWSLTNILKPLLRKELTLVCCMLGVLVTPRLRGTTRVVAVVCVCTSEITSLRHDLVEPDWIALDSAAAEDDRVVRAQFIQRVVDLPTAHARPFHQLL